jgi:hypothetical protein
LAAQINKALRITVALSVLSTLVSCDQPHAVNESVFAHIPNAAVLTLAFPGPNGSARAESYGVFSTLEACTAARKVYVDAKPQKFTAPSVDFACIIDPYNPTERQTADNAAIQ